MSNFNKTQPQQWEVFLKCFERNPEFATGKISACGSKENFKKTWEELTLQLNLAGTVKKPVDKWQKTWADYKWGLKKKIMCIHKQVSDGDPFDDSKLSTMEERFLKILGDTFYESCVTAAAAAADQSRAQENKKTEDVGADSPSSSTNIKRRKLCSNEKNNQDFEEIYIIKEEEIEDFENRNTSIDGNREIEEDFKDGHESQIESQNEYSEIIKLKMERMRMEKERRFEELEVKRRELALEERKLSFKEQKLKVEAEQQKKTTELLLKMAQIMENIVNKAHEKTDT